MKIHLAYGKRGLDVDIPGRNLIGVLHMQGAKAIVDPGTTLKESLDNPIGSVPLADLAFKAKNACIVVCDITRPVPNQVLLPPILEALARGGIQKNNITILIATGLHRPSTPDEREAIVGTRVLREYRVADHHARESDEHRYLGRTRRNTPVHIDKKYVESDLKITIGFIEPHLMAGFSGGRKLIAPGCAGETTILSLHSPRFIEHQACCEGSMEGNPLHDELLEIAQMAGHDFMVDVSLDRSRAITGIFAGTPLLAHSQGVTFVRQSAKASLPEPADIVITTSAGYPLDLTLYQAVKGMTAALPAVKKGGMLIVAAECAEGLGSPEFSRMATSFRDVDAFLEKVNSQPVEIDQWQLEECAKVAQKAEVILVSESIAKKYQDSLFIRCAGTVEDGLREGLQKFGGSATVAVIPDGPYTLVSTVTN